MSRVSGTIFEGVPRRDRMLTTKGSTTIFSRSAFTTRRSRNFTDTAQLKPPLPTRRLRDTAARAQAVMSTICWPPRRRCASSDDWNCIVAAVAASCTRRRWRWTPSLSLRPPPEASPRTARAAARPGALVFTRLVHRCCPTTRSALYLGERRARPARRDPHAPTPDAAAREQPPYRISATAATPPRSAEQYAIAHRTRFTIGLKSRADGTALCAGMTTVYTRRARCAVASASSST